MLRNRKTCNFTRFEHDYVATTLAVLTPTGTLEHLDHVCA